MKKLLLTLFAVLLTFMVIGQKTGVSRSVKLDYVTYAKGHYYVVLNNLQECVTPFLFQWEGRDSIIRSLGPIRVIKLPSPVLSERPIRARPLYRCGTTKNGYWDSSFVEIRALETKNL